ncbi:MAG TPA: hypothetical protein VE261_00365, partial [Gaiellaceae bacterium]|nr:hypothetical protein [Gaiellaceae bacterium]
MIRALIEAIAKRLPNPRVIYDREGGTPYLSRYYIFGAPKMPDGSAPFDELGAPRVGIDDWARYGVYLHKFHRSDDADDLHNHPWAWSFSIILAGGYVEERLDDAMVADGLGGWHHRVFFSPPKRIEVRRLTAPSFNFIRESTFHRVDLIEADAWTLFIAGPKVS